MSLSVRRLHLAALAALAIGAAIPAGAEAAGCPVQDASQTFLPWGDSAFYELAPDGGFEDGASGWTLSGGAAAQQGNESYQVGGAGDQQSLALPDGAVAKSPRLCIDIAHPTIRFFARDDGSSGSVLRVSVLYRGLLGIWLSVPLGSVTAGEEWAPTPPVAVLVNLLSVLHDSQVVYRFEADGGDWSVDDLYVDPYTKG